MTQYLDVEFESDPDALAQLAFDYLTAVIPNWAPAEGNLDVWLIRASARVAAEVQEMSSAVPTTIFRYAGANLFNLPPIDAQPALGHTTWTMRDSLGYTIPDGTLVAIRLSGDVLVPFQTRGDVIVPAGSTTTAAGEVLIEAVNPGADGSGLTGTMELIDSIGFVNTITLVAPGTTGGIDAETDDAYLNRLTLQLTLLAPRPIIPSDFAAMAVDVPGVYRALALDGYDPVANTYGNERTITVVMVDINGNAVSTATKTAVANLLESNREVNFQVNVIDPTFNTIDVTFQVKAEPNITDAADLTNRVAQAVTTYLSAETWGLPSSGDAIAWINEDTVRYLSLADVIHSVQGVRYIEALAIGIAGGAQTAADHLMDGAAPMPVPGNIAGSTDL